MASLGTRLGAFIVEAGLCPACARPSKFYEEAGFYLRKYQVMLNLFWTESKLCVVLLPGVGKLRKDARVISAIILCRIASISWLDSLQVITWLPLSRVRSLQELDTLFYRGPAYCLPKQNHTVLWILNSGYKILRFQDFC